MKPTRAAVFIVVLLSVGISRGFAADDSTPPKVNVACVGDSITYGDRLKDRDHDSYPAQLARLLGDRYIVENFGVNATTMLVHGDVPYIKQKANAAALAFRPDVVVIALGTNDSKPQNWKMKDEFEGDYAAFIKPFRDVNPQVSVYVCEPPPCFPGRWGITEKVIVNEVDPKIREVARQQHAQVIDLHSASINKKDMCSDTVHPNPIGAVKLAACVAEAVIQPEK